MCTVIIEVPRSTDGAARVLAIRDEDPARPWDAPGPWWPETHPGVHGVRDRRANGAWLAVAERPGRLAVILNRGEVSTPDPGSPLQSRGTLVLDAVSGTPHSARPRTAAYNLVEVRGAEVEVTSWDGSELTRTPLDPGVHMIAHHSIDDVRTPRIARWLPEFVELGSQATLGRLGTPDSWKTAWLDVLERSAELGPANDESIIRDNRAHGYPTLSLLVCVAEVSDSTVTLESAELATPGVWTEPEFLALA